MFGGLVGHLHQQPARPDTCIVILNVWVTFYSDLRRLTPAKGRTHICFVAGVAGSCSSPPRFRLLRLGQIPHAFVPTIRETLRSLFA